MAPCTGWSSLAFLATGLLSVCPVRILAQASTAQCLSSFSWMDNSRSQSPCLVAAYLQGACNGGQFTVGPLLDGTHYTGPFVDEQNQCQCNSVTYNTISACGLCQNRTIISWTAWDFNCTTIYPGFFPPGVPDGTAVPQWAFQDVTTSDMFNPTLAQAVGDSPESTATYVQSTNFLSATSISASASLTALPSATSTNTSSGSSSNTGAIAGGVVGGVVGVALITGVAIVALCLMRKKRSQIPPLAQYTTDPTSPMSGYSEPTPFPPQMVQPKLYDPSDPSTFPITPPPAFDTTRPSSIVYSSVSGYPATNYSHPIQPSGSVPEL